MRPSPAEEWQRLTKHYGEMSDGQLLELAEGFGDLTEVAQPILRDEMKKRGLPDPTTPAKPAPVPKKAEGEGEDEGEPVEYTWKVLLRQCDTTDEAWYLKSALQRQGLDAWVVEPDATTITGVRFPKVFVAADQLEEAQRIAAQPIPQDVLDEANEPLPEDFVAPECPRCHASESLLVSIEPTNQWRCDECGAEWSDPAAADAPSSEPVS
jgi:hypothetical protein